MTTHISDIISLPLTNLFFPATWTVWVSGNAAHHLEASGQPQPPVPGPLRQAGRPSRWHTFHPLPAN